MRPQTFERLHRLGIEAVTLCLDNDEAGRGATARAVENAARARQSPEVYVIDPERLSPANDRTNLLRQRGVAAWRDLVKARRCGIAWRPTNSSRSPPIRQSPNVAPRSRARGQWLGRLPPRLAIEQEDAIRVIAEQCGYSAEAVTRCSGRASARP